MGLAHTSPCPATRLLPLLLLVTMLQPSAGSAQRPRSPFETLDLSFTVLGDINHGTLHRHWSPGAAFGAGVALPFYLGSVEAGIQYAHPDPLGADVPGFRSLFAYAGWGGDHPLGARVDARGGLRVGVAAMRFDGDTIPAFRRRESELGIAARAGVRWTPVGTWFVESSLTFQSILTRPRMEQVFITASLGRRFRTPGWLRDFLD